MKVIARIQNGFDEKFGIPRQGVLCDIESRIIFEKDYRNPDYIRGLEEFSYIWLLWGFSEFFDHKEKATIRPPRLGGKERVGVFATRSPIRPNPIALTSVKLERIEISKTEGPILVVKGADMMNNSPIYDIKPYIAYADCHRDAKNGFVDKNDFTPLNVVIPDGINIDDSIKEDIIKILSSDPRPQYIEDDERVYGLSYYGNNIKFKVKENILTVLDFVALTKKKG